MQKMRCEHCKLMFSSAGIRGHLRFKHQIDSASPDDYSPVEIEDPMIRVNEKIDQVMTPTFPVHQKEDFLDQMERQLQQQLRIKNMSMMMQQLNAPPTPTAQRDTLSEVVTTMDLIEKIQDRVRIDDPDNSPSQEEQMIMQFLSNMSSKKEDSAPAKLENKEVQEIHPMFIPPKIKEKIATGEISQEQVVNWLKENGFSVSDNSIKEFIDDQKENHKP